MTSIFSILLFTVFSFLGGIHFYWLFGGKWGLKQAIPTKPNEANKMTPPPLATLIVALILLGFGLLYFIKSGVIAIPVPTLITSYAYWCIPALFFIRAIGEFHYVGFFKKVTQTEFAKADTKLFSPLCLGISIMGLLVQLL